MDVIDSTNNYAMRLIDADSAQDGMTITTGLQMAGKGQRGKQWQAEPFQSILMSLIVEPRLKIEDQFLLSMLVAVAIVDAIEGLGFDMDVKIKWPNDIIVGDKKTGGILIENVLRGSEWNYAVIGIGLNVLQHDFPAELVNATSLKIALGKEIEMIALRDEIRFRIFKMLDDNIDSDDLLARYNSYLYKKGMQQQFSDGENVWTAFIESVMRNGKLMVTEADGNAAYYIHGLQNWVY